MSSIGAMKENGWNIDNINTQAARLVLPKGTCNWMLLDAIETHDWYEGGWDPSSISTNFWDHGKVTLRFGNCNDHGEVTILVDGTEIKKSRPKGGETTAVFMVNEGSNLTIATDNRGIIKLMDLKIECGELIMVLEWKTSPFRFPPIQVV